MSSSTTTRRKRAAYIPDCAWCPRVGFETWTEFKKHMREEHPRPRFHECPECGERFEWTPAFRKHLERHLPFDDQRFMANVYITSMCWPWTGSTDSKGYGKIMVQGRTEGTHRVMYRFVVGPIPEGYEIDHLCRNKLCCRPDHLEAVTHAENTRRGHAATQMKCPHCDLMSGPGNIKRHIARKHPGTDSNGDA